MCKNEEFKLKIILPCRPKRANPYSSYVLTPYFYPSYGVGILTAFLRQHKYYVKVEDLSIRLSRHNIFLASIFKNIDLDILRNTKVIRRFLESGDIKGKLSLYIDKILDSSSIEGFDAIGFSVFSSLHFIPALMLSKRIKERNNVPLIFGGSFITLYGHLYPEIFNFIDYMIVGDGRVPLLKLIDYLNKKITISEVPNLIYRENGKSIITFRRHYPIEDVPVPDFDGLPMELYINRILKREKNSFLLPYQISKGCVSRCSFCSNTTINDKLEFKSYDKILTELWQMRERYNSNKFHFCDDAINNSYEYLEELCDLFIKNRLNINWSVYAKVGNLDRHILRKMKEAGCYGLRFGIESGSNNILRRMNKGFTSEEASKTLRDAAELGLRNSICLIAGYPYETQEDIKQTIDFIRKNRKYIRYTNIYIFGLTYHSPIYCNPEKYGVTNLIPTRPRFCFAFDESRGLKWEQKQKQQEDSQRQIIKVVYKNIVFQAFIFHLHTSLKSIIYKIINYFNAILLLSLWNKK